MRFLLCSFWCIMGEMETEEKCIYGSRERAMDHVWSGMGQSIPYPDIQRTDKFAPECLSKKEELDFKELVIHNEETAKKVCLPG